MTEIDIACGHNKITLHARGVGKSRKITTFSHLNSSNFNDNFKDNFMWEQVKSTMVILILSFASFMFFHHLYFWERYQIAFWCAMDTSPSIGHWFDVKIPPGKFVEIKSILKGESTWKLWHRFDVDILMWIQFSKSTKYQRVLHVDFSVLFRGQTGVTFVLAVSILSFSNIFCSGNLFYTILV